MKNIVALRDEGAIRHYVHGLWRSTLFRESDYVGRWVDRFAAQPRVFAEMSDVELEYPHFGTWFGMTYLRTYSEPVVSDLYYLHELVHAILLTYESQPLFTAWYRKMTTIELSASLETECFVYLSIPGLRDMSFPDEIWADRYLGGERRLGESLRDVIRQDRYKAMHHPDPMDYCEQQIAAYARQKFEWANGWKLPDDTGTPTYRVVEHHMTSLRNGSIGIDAHVAWLESRGEIPFEQQARAFARHYWRNKIGQRLNP
jgi:hypothetical protein